MSVLDHAVDQPMKLEEHATASLAGGIMNYGYQCGMLWGAALAAGAQAYRLYSPGPQAETRAIIAAQRVLESFRGCTKNEINCLEITDLNMQGKIQIIKLMKFFIKGGPVGCVRMITKYSPKAFAEINTALSEELTDIPSTPVSCAAMLAKKMDVPEMHSIMVAGLAGGIGLCGGACGALGAAIWIIGMKGKQEGLSNKAITLRASGTIDRFLRSTEYKFECSEIVGRKFENVADHAVYLGDGGCSEIIEVLATGPPDG